MESNPNHNTDQFTASNGQEEELNLRDLLRVAHSHSSFITSFTLIVILLAGLYAFLWPPTYEATTTVKVPDISQTAQGMLRMLVPMSGSGDPIQTYVEICQSQTVAASVAKALKLSSLAEYSNLTDQEITEKLLKKTVKVTNVKTSNVLSITTRSHDPQLAASLANTWAQAFIAVNLDVSHKGAQSKREFLEGQAKEMKTRLNSPHLRLNDESKADEVIYAQLLQELQQAQIEEKVNDAGIVVVDTGVVPEKPVSPKKLLTLILGLLLGLAGGLQGAFLLERFQDRLKHEDQLKKTTGLANLAVIPDFKEEYPEGMAPPDPKERFSPKVLIQNPVFQHAYYRESFKIFRTNLTYARADKPVKVVTVLSSGPEEGKTLVNANLAISLAQAGKKVLLVDADLRKSSVRKIFGIENGMETGLPLALTGQRPWKELTRPSGVENLDLIPNTVAPPNPAELLGSETMRKLIEDFRKTYDYVVLDGAPVLPVTDSVVLSTYMDGVLLLARWNATRSHELHKALSHLRNVGAPILGTVLNFVQMKKNLYGYGYGYGYGGYGKYRYGSETHSEQEAKK
ncbi:MAG TPA: polysaccharide biosynthesis tyrosine autokinase [bacterium]|nr:polysaccharide biosynthesis tyrosine autokinase [bacterium]